VVEKLLVQGLNAINILKWKLETLQSIYNR